MLGPVAAELRYSLVASFVDHGDETVHTALNLGATPVELWATYIVPGPAGAPFGLDAPDPGCDF